MKRWLFRGVAIFAVLGVLGTLVSASGIVPIPASSGHFGVTEAVIQFSKRRSVAMHASSDDLPPLDAPWLVAKGAGHYETGCRPCHGSPDFQEPRVARAMLPSPPYLGSRVPQWKPAELFYIVKHGLKFTGMPAWPAQERDDEVGAVVAFLLRLPDLDGGAYEHLVHGEPRPADAAPPIADLSVPEAVKTCARCHAIDGLSRGSPAFPKLAGQKAEYIAGALDAYVRGARHSGIMQPIAAALRASDVQAVAEYYARLPSGSAHSELDSAAQRGRAIAERGVRERRVPSCRDCHGPEPVHTNANYPILAGQWKDYLILQLELFKRGQRGGSPYAHLMEPAFRGLTGEEMRDVAAFYASGADAR
jgi:cytochrome c553